MKRRIFLLLVLAVLIAVAFAITRFCVYKEKTVRGRVVDQNTSSPIDSATVMITWQGKISSVVGGHTVILGTTIVQTDADGEYKAVVRSDNGIRCFVFDPSVHVHAYKPGFSWPVRQYVPPQDNDVFLVPFKGAAGEKLELIRRVSTRNGGGAGGDSPEYRFAKSLYLEAKQLVSEMESATEHQKSIVDSLQYNAASYFVDPQYFMDSSLRASLIERHIRIEFEGKPRLRY